MFLQYDIFYKLAGIRKIQNLRVPTLTKLNNFPKNSAVHLITYNEESLDINPDETFFEGYTKKLLLLFPTENYGTYGSPVPINFIEREHFSSFIRLHNSKFRYEKDAEKSGDQLQLLIYNHDYSKGKYRYQQVKTTAFDKWHNRTLSLFKVVNDAVNKTGRHQFVIFDSPEDIPGRLLLEQNHDKSVNTMLSLFGSSDRLLVLHLFRFLLSDLRKDSVIDQIEKKNYSKVTISFKIRDGRLIHLNLAYLYSWIKGNENLTPLPSIQQIGEVELLKMFLAMLLILSSNSPEEFIDDEEEETSTSTESEEDKQFEQERSTEISSITEEELTTEKKDKKTISDIFRSSKKQKDIEDADVDVILEEVDTYLNTLDELDKSHANKAKREVKAVALDETPIVDDIEAIVKELDDINTESSEDIAKSILESKDPVSVLEEEVNNSFKSGEFNSAEYRKALKDVEKYKNSVDPFDKVTPIAEATSISTEDLSFKEEHVSLPDNPMVFDKDMLKSVLNSYTRDYVKKNMKKDKLRAVKHIQNGKVAIRSHEVEIVHSVNGSVEQHRIELKPLNGVASAIWMKVPLIEEDGTFIANGNKAIMRKQRVDVPIRKISPNEVALSTYYGKTFVHTATKKSTSPLEYLSKAIDADYMGDRTFILSLVPGNTFDSYREAPWIYNALSTKYRLIQTKYLTLVLEPEAFDQLKDTPAYAKVMASGGRYIGYSKAREPIYVDNKNEFYVNAKGGVTHLGNIYDVLNIDELKTPIEYSEVNIFSKAIPVAIVLGFTLGITKLIKMLKVKPRIVPSKSRKNLSPHEYVIRFNDVSLIVSRKDRLASMILGGFTAFDKQLVNYSYKDLDHKDVYMNLMAAKKLTIIYYREMENMLDYFVDHISETTLRSMGEPTKFEGLLFRSSEMLLTYTHPSSQDTNYQVVRGYERISGIMYGKMMESMRAFRNKNIYGKSKIEMSPFAVWQAIMSDESIKLVEDINPLQNLKEDEIVTYVGSGGRSKGAINRASRGFHKNDVGVVSEATVDSGDVGVNAYLTSNPRFKNQRGVIDKEAEPTLTSMLSTSANMSPFITKDSSQRINFRSIMDSHIVPCEGYHAPYIRTGMGSVVAHRNSPMFAYTAKDEGEVLSVTKHGIQIQYKDGSKVGLPLGRHYGKAEGSVYPHDLRTIRKAGDKFKRGDYITYNTAFFEEDIFSPGNLILKFEMAVRTAFIESKETYEDSSTVSKRHSERLKTKSIKQRSFVIDFDEALHNVKEVGEAVKPNDPLLVIERAITSSLDAFSAKSIEALKQHQRNSPRANYLGIIDNIEVFYHGDKEDMSPSLKALADKCDKVLAAKCKSLGKPVVTGSVKMEHRVGGTPLGVNKAEVRISIIIETSYGTGDKTILCNQMKSVTGSVYDYEMITEDGKPIDRTFSYRAVAARSVNSPIYIAKATTCMKLIQDEFIKIYEGT